MNLHFLSCLTILGLLYSCAQQNRDEISTLQNGQVTTIPAPLPISAFGEIETAEYTPEIQLANKYNINPTLLDYIDTYTINSATVNNNNNMFRCQSGTNAAGFAFIHSADVYIYRAGEGVEARFTSQFTQGAANSLQFAGLFSPSDMLAFGYDGTNFSAIHSFGGVAEIQLITVTATGAGSCIVTLNSVSSGSIAVTNSTTSNNAAEIATGLAANLTLSNDWEFQEVANQVFAISKTAGNKTGLMSISCTGASANIVEDVAGVSPTNNNTPQSSWNITTTPYAGFNPNNLTLYKIAFGYLGVANIVYSIYNPYTALYVPVHQVKWSSLHGSTHLSNPNLHIGWGVMNTGNTTNLTVQGASASVGSQGKHVLNSTTYSISNIISVAGTTVPILSLQNRVVFSDQSNQSVIYPVLITVDNNTTSGQGAAVAFQLNAALTTPNYQYQNEFNSIGLVDTAATSFTGGTNIIGFLIPPASSATFSLADLGIKLNTGDTITVTGRRIGNSGTASLSVQLTWQEDK